MLYLNKKQPLGREKSSDKTDIKLSVPGIKEVRKLFFHLQLVGMRGHGWGMAAVPNARVID